MTYLRYNKYHLPAIKFFHWIQIMRSCTYKYNIFRQHWRHFFFYIRHHKWIFVFWRSNNENTIWCLWKNDDDDDDDEKLKSQNHLKWSDKKENFCLFTFNGCQIGRKNKFMMMMTVVLFFSSMFHRLIKDKISNFSYIRSKIMKKKHK